MRYIPHGDGLEGTSRSLQSGDGRNTVTSERCWMLSYVMETFEIMILSSTFVARTPETGPWLALVCCSVLY